MTDSPPISLVCFDLASIVIDGSIVERAFAEAIATQGIVAGTQDYARSMVRFDRSHGRAPAAVLRDLFDGDEPRAQAASLAFERSFRAAGAAVRARPSGRRRRRDGQDGRVRRQDLPDHDAVAALLRRVPRPAARGGPGPVRRRRAARLPLAGPGAHRDAQARRRGRARGGRGQRHSGRRAVRLPRRSQDRWSAGQRATGRRHCSRQARPTCSTASRRFPTSSRKCRARSRELTLVFMPELPEVEALAVFLREHARAASSPVPTRPHLPCSRRSTRRCPH